MQSLKKRIADLEKAGAINTGLTNIVIRFVTSKKADDELQEFHDWKNGQQWNRQPGETEQELEDRATREVTRNETGCALLMAGGLESLALSNSKPVC